MENPTPVKYLFRLTTGDARIGDRVAGFLEEKGSQSLINARVSQDVDQSPGGDNWVWVEVVLRDHRRFSLWRVYQEASLAAKKFGVQIDAGKLPGSVPAGVLAEVVRAAMKVTEIGPVTTNGQE